MTSYRSGMDAVFTNPGLFKTRKCVVCGAKMDVTRNVFGPTSSSESMGGHKHLHDSFFCPNSDKGWHQIALILVEEIDRKDPQKRL